MHDEGWYRARSFMYVMGILERVKIGRSGSPAKRFRDLQVGSPVDLTVYAIVPEWFCAEAAAHEKWSHLRGRGEWFDVDDQMRAWIGHLRETYLYYESRRAAYLANPKTTPKVGLRVRLAFEIA